MADQLNIVIGAATLKIDGVDVGFTQGGVTLRFVDDYLDVEADQLGGVARKEKTFQRSFVTTTLLEATLQNLRLAIGEPSSQQFGSGSPGTALSFGQASPVVTEHTLVITGKASTGATQRQYTFTRCISIGEVEHLAGARDAASVIPIEFEVLKDPAAGNTFGFARDTTP